MGIYQVAGATGVFELTGNTGGSVGPLGGNINIVGAGTVTVDGDPATHTLTITGAGGGLTEFAVVVGNHAGNVSSLAAVGLTGETLMGSTGANPGWTGSPSFSGTVTAGTGFTVTLGDAEISSGNLIIPTTTNMVGAIVQNNDVILHTFGTDNLFIGKLSGNTTLTVAHAINNTGIGVSTLTSLVGTAVGNAAHNTALGVTALNANTEGSYNTASGSASMLNCTLGDNNSAYGASSQALLLDGSDNSSLGKLSLASITSANENSALGSSAGSLLKTGMAGTYLGWMAGSNYTTNESYNICIGAATLGVVTESNTLRIGAATGVANYNINAAYICGIYGKAVGATSGVTLTDSVDKLGTISGAAGTILVGDTSPKFLPVGVAGQVLSTQGAGSDPHWIDQMAVTGMTEFAVIVGNHTGGVASLAAIGLNGQTLMGNTGANPGWTSSPQFGGSVTALYDISTTAGNLVTLQGNIRAVNSALSAASSILVFEKSRGAAVLTTGDVLGQVRFTGYDGTHLIPAAKIVSTSSGTIAAGRVAGNLEFYTHPDAAIALPSEPLLRLTINSAGNITVANPDAGTALTITNGGLTVSAGTTTLTALASTAATGVLTVSDTGVLAEVETGAAGTILVGTAGSPKFLAAGNAGQILASQGAAVDPHWIDNTSGAGNYAFCACQCHLYSTRNYASLTYLLGSEEPFITVAPSSGFPSPRPAWWTDGGGGTPCSFTAPVNGIYVFNIFLTIYPASLISYNGYKMSAPINGTSTQDFTFRAYASGYYTSQQASFILKLTATDVVTFALTQLQTDTSNYFTSINAADDYVSTFISGYQIA